MYTIANIAVCRKAMIHQQFLTARRSLMEKISAGGNILIRFDSCNRTVSLYTENSDECETLFLNIRQDKVEQFLNGKIDSELRI